jgi:integrase
MAWVKPRVSDDGSTRYTGMYRDLRGRERSAGTFASKRSADRSAQRAEAALAAGRVADPRRGRQLLRDYIEEAWFPHHMIEATTRESYRYLLDRYILPELGSRRIGEVLPGHVREWVLRLQEVHEVNPPTIQKCKFVLDAVFTTALNDQITVLHPGKGVRTPPVVAKERKIVSVEQFDRIYTALNDECMRLLVETDIETGLRWGELTELRPHDLDLTARVITVSRVVVHLKARGRAAHERFVVKEYPKDRERRRVSITPELADKLRVLIAGRNLGLDDLLFCQPYRDLSARRIPDVLPDPAALGLTEPNGQGRRYRHGTTTAYGAGRCRCRHCKDAIAHYRAARRQAGKDAPSRPRTVASDGHISNDWFRTTVWAKALAAADLGFHVTPHGLRHAHASWLLAGGADLQVVKERLGHGSIRTTERYLHALPGKEDAALAALVAIRAAATTSSVVSAAVAPDAAEVLAAMAKIKEIYDGLAPQP